MLTTTPVTTTLVWSPVTRRILGAQFLSKHDISQAANVVSVAIQAGFTIDQLAGATCSSSRTSASRSISSEPWPFRQWPKADPNR